MARKPKASKQVETLNHDTASRKNIPTAELQPIAEQIEEQAPLGPVSYGRANPLETGETRERDADLDPQIIWKGTSIQLTEGQIEALKAGKKIELGEAQLVWRGKDTQDWSDLVTQAPPIYVQEKIHPKAIIEDLKRQTKRRRDEDSGTFDLFGDFNGLDPEARTEFYAHDQYWQNRMILGDSLAVMASLAEREALRGKVQCIYFDPPYGIKFNSNWQVSTRSRDVKDGKLDQITREPEQVKAFRDTWKDGIHSYLTYLRDRLTAMRDLLTESGSIFVQIGDENVHRVRTLMDEVFGEENCLANIIVRKTTGKAGLGIDNTYDVILWYGRNKGSSKANKLYFLRKQENDRNYRFDFDKAGCLQSLRNREPYRIARMNPITSQSSSATTLFEFGFRGKKFRPGKGGWKTNLKGMNNLQKAERLTFSGRTLGFVRAFDDYPYQRYNDIWDDTRQSGFGDPKVYVVQTGTQIAQRCILMATDPGDLVLDPTCGSGTTATVAEQWGRRWITIDTSRVALALARTRLMSARYPYYYLADSTAGREKEQDVSGQIQPDTPVYNDLAQGFVYERAPHIMLKTIANNAEIDVIWEKWQETLEPLRNELNDHLGTDWQEWEIPRDLTQWLQPAKGGKDDRPSAGQAAPAEQSAQLTGVSEKAIQLHRNWWDARIERQQEIDKSIAQKADIETLYDRPYEDTSKVRVAGPFTVESLSPHRVIPADEDTLMDEISAVEGHRAAPPKRPKSGRSAAPAQDFATMVLENLRSAGVHQSDKQDRIEFTAMEGWPGDYIAATGTYEQVPAKGGKGDRPSAGQAAPAEAQAKPAAASDKTSKRAAIFIGPEFGSVTRSDLMAAARESSEARFDMLIACGFNFDAHSSEVNKLGPLPILKAKMNPDLHMADDLKNTGKGNLFVVFGEPDVEWGFEDDGNIIVEVLGIDVFDPKTNEVRASGKNDIAAWFIDTDYNEESFFVRHAYFMGANDPYQSLKTSLKAEIDEEAWATLYRDKSRPFAPPSTGRFAVKVINHFGDEVMKVFGV